MSSLRDLPHPAICHADLMLATPAKAPFSAAGWLYELKYDGYRCMVSKRGYVVRLDSRNGNDMSDRFPELVAELQTLERDFVVDSELVMVDELVYRPLNNFTDFPVIAMIAHAEYKRGDQVATG